MILPHKSIPTQPMLINFKEHSFPLSSCAGHPQLQTSYGQYCRRVSKIRRSSDSSHDAPSALPFYHSQNTYRTHSTPQLSSNDNRGSTRAGNHLISTSCFPFRIACTHNAPSKPVLIELNLNKEILVAELLGSYMFCRNSIHFVTSLTPLWHLHCLSLLPIATILQPLPSPLQRRRHLHMHCLHYIVPHHSHLLLPIIPT